MLSAYEEALTLLQAIEMTEVRQGRLGDGANVILWCLSQPSANRSSSEKIRATVRTTALSVASIARSGYINPYLFSIEGSLWTPQVASGQRLATEQRQLGQDQVQSRQQQVCQIPSN